MNRKSTNILGPIFIVAGTTIGAGMLAMPLTSSSAGFLWTSLYLVFLWIGMLSSALLTVELNLANKETLTIYGLSQKYLNKLGGTLGSLSLMLLFVSLLAAYASGGSSILYEFFDQKFDTHTLTILFVILFGGWITISMKSADYINRLLFIAMIVGFVIIMGSLSSEISIGYLSRKEPFSLSHLSMIPVLFTTLGVHGSIPSIMKYVGQDRSKIYKIFIIGSGVPLFIYMCWQAIALGIIPLTGDNSFETIQQSENALGTFVAILGTQSSNTAFEFLTEFFTFFAISTSFLGVGISLFDFYGEVFGKTFGKHRITLSMMTFVPSLIIALYVPHAFIFALEFAALALAVLAILLPCVILYKMHKKAIIKPTALVTKRWFVFGLYLFGLFITTIVINTLMTG